MLEFHLIPDSIEKKGIELAKAQSEWEYLDNNLKNILSSLMLEYDGAISHREMLARSNPKYTTYLESVREAREEMLTLKAEINALEISFEFFRTNNANERARINLR